MASLGSSQASPFSGGQLDSWGVNSCNDGTFHGTVAQESTPVLTLPPPAPLASAHVVFFGHYGDVSALATQRGVSRQTLYREAHAVVRALDAQTQRPPDDDLRQRLTDLQTRLGEAERRLAAAVLWEDAQQAEFVATAQALGVSLTSTHCLLAVVLGAASPSRAALGRFARAAGRRAGAALRVLDAYSRGRAQQVAADEIFVGKKPVLMTVEQDSLCWLGGRLADSREGTEWAQEFRQLPAAAQVTCDRGQGLAKGLKLVNAERAQAGAAAIADQSDHFHPVRRAWQALRPVQREAEAALAAAARLQAAYDAAGRQGTRRPPAQGRALQRAWRQAEAAFDRWGARERALARLRAGLRLFTPEGELNTPERAAAEAQAALAEMAGPGLDKVARGLRPEAFTFLRRAHAQLAALTATPAAATPAAATPAAATPAAATPAAATPAAATPAAATPAAATPAAATPAAATPAAATPAPPLAGVPAAAALVRAAVRVQGLRARPELLAGEGPQARTLRGVLLAANVTLALAGEAGARAQTLVRRVLAGAWRASSLVEGLNSVVRMHQGRQKRLTQGLLDLKRLYWNLHEFRAGKRRKSSPYGRLGLALPKGSWWQLLQRPPEQLQQELFALNPAA
jgi:hypothetical protein